MWSTEHGKDNALLMSYNQCSIVVIVAYDLAHTSGVGL